MLKRRLTLICFSVLMLLLQACSLGKENEAVISGTIEADELPIVTEVQGIVQTVKAEEGTVLFKDQAIAEGVTKSDE